MTICTGRGDRGLTDLWDGSRVSKTDPRVEAGGTVDELNARLGMIVPTGHDDLDYYLTTVQNHLHVVQAEIANPASGEDDPVITDDHVETVEGWIDETQEELDPLDSFVLPGGGEVGASLHHARAVCRRAERRIVAALEADDSSSLPVVYLNRLSDALFVFARNANRLDRVEEDSPHY